MADIKNNSEVLNDIRKIIEQVTIALYRYHA
jgi:hypothetical protein